MYIDIDAVKKKPTKSLPLCNIGRVSFKNFFSVAQPGYHLTKFSSPRENLVARLEKKRCLILNIF